MPRQHVPRVARLQEVNAVDLIALEVDVLVAHLHERFQQWANPADERHRPVLKEVKLLEDALEDEKRHLQAQVLGQGLGEGDHLFRVVRVLLFERFLGVFVQLQGEAVFFIDPVEYLDLLVHLLVLLIVRLQQVR